MITRRTWAFVLLIALMVSLVCPYDRAAAGNEESRVQIQDSLNGYAIHCPADVTAIRFDPEGILHILFPSVNRVLTIHTQANPDALSTTQWIDAWLSGKLPNNPDGFGPPPGLVSRRSLSIRGRTGEEIVWHGLNELHRRIVISGKERIYLIDHPMLGDSTDSVLDRSVATFVVGVFPKDVGFSIIAPESTQSITALNVPYYSQRADPWKCDQYGTCIVAPSWHTCTQSFTTIEDAGCHITSQAMIFDYYTGHWMDPRELNNCLTSNSQYSWQSDFQGLCAAPDYSSVCMPSSVTYEEWFYISTSQAVLDADLASGYPAVGRRADNGHSVAIIGKSGGDYVINDPWDGPNIVVSPGWFLGFWRYHGPVGTCCGCLPASCCSAAEIAQASNLPAAADWAESGALGSATLAPDTKSSICQRPSAQVAVFIADEEVESGVPDEPDLLYEALPSVADASALQPVDVFPEEPDPIDSQVPGPSPAQWEAVEPQRTPPTSANYSIVKSVFGSGGGKKSSTNYVMNSTQGQTTDLSRRASASYVLLPGYWGASSPHSFDYRVYLPVILRED